MALVTGGARGIGAAIAEVFAQEGAKVAIGDILTMEGEATAKAIGRSGGEAIFLHLDVTDEESWKRGVKAVVAELGGLDILVNNAGIGMRAGLEEVSREEWQSTLDVNSKGPYLGTKHAAPEMAQRGGGSIVNISSIAAMVGGDASVAYRASKGALRSLTKAMAIRYASQGIRVNSIHPGDVITPMSEPYLADSRRLRERIALVPLGRLGRPRDIAYLALYLASDEASYVTGIEIVIDGGRTAQ